MPTSLLEPHSQGQAQLSLWVIVWSSKIVTLLTQLTALTLCNSVILLARDLARTVQAIDVYDLKAGDTVL